jgi:hypothetical protein
MAQNGLDSDLKPAADDPTPAVKAEKADEVDDDKDQEKSVDLEHIFFPPGEDDEDAVSALPGPDPLDDDRGTRSKSSIVSQGTVLSFSQCQWLNMKPVLTFGDWPDTYESEPWFKYVMQARKSMEAVASSLDSVLDSLPKALDALDTKMEEQFVSKRDLPADLASDVRDLTKQLEFVSEFLWGYSSSPIRAQFVSDHGAVLGAVVKAIKELEVLRSELNSAKSDSVHKDQLEVKLLEVSTKAAETITLISDQATAQLVALTDRVAWLEQLSGESGNPLEAIMSAAKAKESEPAGSADSKLASSTETLRVVNGQPITLDWIVEKLMDQDKTIKSQKKEIDGLRSSAYAQGVKVESHHFDSLEAIVALLQADEIDPDTCPSACDCMSIWAHYMLVETKTRRRYLLKSRPHGQRASLILPAASTLLPFVKSIPPFYWVTVENQLLLVNVSLC